LRRKGGAHQPILSLYTRRSRRVCGYRNSELLLDYTPLECANPELAHTNIAALQIVDSGCPYRIARRRFPLPVLSWSSRRQHALLLAWLATIRASRNSDCLKISHSFPCRMDHSTGSRCRAEAFGRLGYQLRKYKRVIIPCICTSILVSSQNRWSKI